MERQWKSIKNNRFAMIDLVPLASEPNERAVLVVEEDNCDSHKAKTNCFVKYKINLPTGII